jgi:hypothetical protein
MPNKKISWLLNVQVDGGPKISIPNSMEIEAYDVVETVIPKKSGAAVGKVELHVQPSMAAAVKVVLISLSDPKQYGELVTYSVNDDIAEDHAAERIKLDAALFLAGVGATSLFGKDPNTFFFYNATDEDATVQILVGRKATT